MKNKYQKPAIYLTPEHTEGIYLASGAAGAAGATGKERAAYRTDRGMARPYGARRHRDFAMRAGQAVRADRVAEGDQGQAGAPTRRCPERGHSQAQTADLRRSDNLQQ